MTVVLGIILVPAVWQRSEPLQSRTPVVAQPLPHAVEHE